MWICSSRWRVRSTATLLRTKPSDSNPSAPPPPHNLKPQICLAPNGGGPSTVRERIPVREAARRSWGQTSRWPNLANAPQAKSPSTSPAARTDTSPSRTPCPIRPADRRDCSVSSAIMGAIFTPCRIPQCGCEKPRRPARQNAQAEHCYLRRSGESKWKRVDPFDAVGGKVSHDLKSRSSDDAWYKRPEFDVHPRSELDCPHCLGFSTIGGI